MTSPARDLTRWNRPGLSRIEYVGANAVTLLDRLAVEVRQRFGAEWDPSPPGDDPLARYSAGPGDPGWELLRALARASHIVGAHIDAYANETLIRTATQPEFLRRLVALLGYEPAPASSATTPIVFDVTETTGVPAGTAVRHKPPEGAPIIFETLLRLDADPALNAIRAVGADANPLALPNPFPLEDDVPLVLGDPLVLEHADSRIAVRVTSVARDAGGRPLVSVAPDPPAGFTIGGTRVRIGPRDRLRARGPTAGTAPPGTTVRLARATTGLRVDEIVWVSTPTSVTFAKVTTVHPFALDLSRSPSTTGLPPSAVIGPAIPVPALSGEHGVEVLGEWKWLRGETVGIGDRRLRTRRFGTIDAGGVGARAAGFTFMIPPVTPDQIEDATVADASYDERTGRTLLTFQATLPFTPSWIFVLPQGAEASGIPVDPPLASSSGALPTTIHTSEVARSEVGDWVVLADETTLCVGKAATVVARPDASADISVDRWDDTGHPFHPATTTVFSHFASSSRIRGWGRNDSPLLATPTVELDDVPTTLLPGRAVVVSHEPEDVGGMPVAAATRVLEISRGPAAPVPGPATVTFTDPVPAEATVGSLAVRANVALAGDGETASPAVIGSGSGDRVHQRFSLPGSDVSSVPDPGFPSGVRLDIEIVVDGRRWQQVPSLRDSEADGHEFEARLADDGRAVVFMGDEVHGRRVPTGDNNVIARWRVGGGLSGNLPSESLTDLVRPVRGVSAVRQPIPATGGGAGDSADFIRANAPRSVLALDRAVSLADYEALAAARSDVWQAWAHEPPGARRGGAVEVVVVSAGGRGLGAGQRDAITATLAAASPPSVSVAVRDHRPVRLLLGIVIEVRREAFDPERVRIATLDHIARRFSVEARTLGQRITREEVTIAVEEVDGVANATCTIGEATGAAVAARAIARDGSGAIRLVHAEPDQLISLDPDGAGATVVAEDFRP